jgi:hypothetical protein
MAVMDNGQQKTSDEVWQAADRLKVVNYEYNSSVSNFLKLCREIGCHFVKGFIFEFQILTVTILVQSTFQNSAQHEQSIGCLIAQEELSSDGTS